MENIFKSVNNNPCCVIVAVDSSSYRAAVRDTVQIHYRASRSRYLLSHSSPLFLSQPYSTLLYSFFLFLSLLSSFYTLLSSFLFLASLSVFNSVSHIVRPPIVIFPQFNLFPFFPSSLPSSNFPPDHLLSPFHLI